MKLDSYSKYYNFYKLRLLIISQTVKLRIMSLNIENKFDKLLTFGNYNKFNVICTLYPHLLLISAKIKLISGY